MRDRIRMKPKPEAQQQFAQRWRCEQVWLEKLQDQVSARLRSDPGATLLGCTATALELSRMIDYGNGRSEKVDGPRLVTILMMYAQQKRNEIAVLKDMIEAMRGGKLQ